jgi:hypothetical protein
MAANADVIEFSYTFDANSLGISGQILAGIIDGTVLDDGDTIVINSCVSATLITEGFDDYLYEIGDMTDIRAATFGDTPVMSFSGIRLDFWVCSTGFVEFNDCPFGEPGGFLISHLFAGGAARAGAAPFGPTYRVQDRPINVDNWSATRVPEPGTLALLGIGLFGMGLGRRRKKV